jgi:ribosome biogenesis protein Nip4
MIKEGYELIKIILDNDYDNPYYYFVKTKDKIRVVKKIIKLSSKWSIGDIEQDNYGGFDDCLDEFIVKNKLDIHRCFIEEFAE